MTVIDSGMEERTKNSGVELLELSKRVVEG